VSTPPTGSCRQCARAITVCDECDASGIVADETCEVCDGEKYGCPVHHAAWK
jgi:hypothetical protein